MRAMGPTDFVRDLITGRDTPPRAILQSEVRETIYVDLGNAVTGRRYPSVKADGGRVDVRVAAPLELAEAVPAEPDCIEQNRVEDMNFADCEVVGYGRGHAKPRA